MAMNSENSSRELVAYKPSKLKNLDQHLAIRREQVLSAGYVPHFGLAGAIAGDKPASPNAL